MNRRFAPLAVLLVFVSILCVCLGGLALADSADAAPPLATLPPSYPHEESEYQILLYESNDSVRGLKKALRDFGYYPSGSSSDAIKALETKYLDDLTMLALENCCDNERNSGVDGLVFDEYGVLATTYYAIIEGRVADLNAPEVTQSPEASYETITWNATGEAVRHVQQRLRELGYLENFETDDSGMWIYDALTRQALDDFLENNGISYDQRENGGITQSIQAILDQEDLKPKASPEPSPSPEPSATPAPSDKLHDYWLKPVSVFGIQMPNLVIWLIGLALVVLIVLAIIHFFVPSADGDGSGKGSVRKAGLTPVTFTITYGSKTEKYTCVIPKILRIGRNVGKFPLNLEDDKISRRHCEIYYLNNQLMLRDYSANGTTVNDRFINNGECKLNNGDRLEIGGHIIIVNY